MAQSKLRVAVVGVDFSQNGDEAICEGLRQLASGGLHTLHAVHVLDPADVIDDREQPALATELEVLERAPALVVQRIQRIADSIGVRFESYAVVPHARIGKAVETILQVAVDYDADLILVGTHGRRGIDRLVLGSVAERLVRLARCPVLVARNKDYSGLTKTQLPDKPYAPGEAPAYHTAPDVSTHVSTESPSWQSNDAGPTGFRIV